MQTIKINNKIVLVPDDVINEYVKYIKVKNKTYFKGIEDLMFLHIKNIVKYFDNFQTFKEIEPEIEKIAIDLLWR